MVLSLAGVTAAAVLASSALVWQNVTGVAPDKKIELITSCMTDALEPGSFLYNSTSGGDPTNVFQTRVDCARVALGDPETSDEVTTVLAAMFALSKTNDTARLACHDLAHEYGAWAYESLGDAALVPGYSDCGFGYYHGAMQRALEDGEIGQRVKSLREFCGRLARADGFLDGGRFTFCSHGVGHAVGTAPVTLQTGIEACQVMDLPQEESERLLEDGSPDPLHIPAELECFTGFLNEKMSTRLREGKAQNSTQGSLTECEDLRSPYRSRCLSYSLFYSDVPLRDVRQVCATLTEDDLRSGCWEGVGYRGGRVLVAEGATKEPELTEGLDLSRFDRDPAVAAGYMNRLCAGDDRHSCVIRFALETVQRLQQPQIMRQICAGLARPDDGSECLRAVDRVADIQGG